MGTAFESLPSVSSAADADELLIVQGASASKRISRLNLLNTASTGFESLAVATTAADADELLLVTGGGTASKRITKANLFTGQRARIDALYGAWTTDADAATITMDWSVTNRHETTLTAARTIAFSNDVDGQAITIVFKSNGSGAYTPTWPAGIKWQGGAAPTLTNSNGHWDVVNIMRESSGNYIGSYALNFS